MSKFIKGHLLDTFIDDNRLLICFISQNGERLFLYYNFNAVFYVKSSYKFIKNFSARFKIPFFITYKRDIYLQKEIKVFGIKVCIKDFYNIKNYLINQENIEVYNVDISPVLQFYFTYNIFPLAKVKIEYQGNKLLSIISEDSAFETNYTIPDLNILAISPLCKGNPKFYRWEGIEIFADDEHYLFEDINSKIFFETVANIFLRYNPDIVITRAGDPIILPLLKEGAEKFGIKLSLSRPSNINLKRKKATTFFSYGKVVFRDAMTLLKGRVHIDILNSFFFKNANLEGVVEVARLTALPLQDAARISPGSAISTMEIRTAFKKDYLIPATKAYPEHFKKAIDLIKVDKGGISFMPPVGVFKNVAEIDFFSMYPSIISKFNISVETFNCKCCRDISQQIRIPDTDYYFCRKKRGIIPETIEPLILKRKKYKELLRGNYSESFDCRQNAIKWILVTCFGYLGYKNAKFGCVEAHEATTAAGREILLQAKEIAEEEGFQIIYGVTDSLYIYKKGSKKEDYKEIVKKISEKTGFILNLEGIYKIIKFLPSSENDKKRVMNKFFGVFEDNRIKARGLMFRKRDTPEFIKGFQKKVLEHLGDKDFAKQYFQECLRLLENREVGMEQLIIKKRITRKPDEYKKKSIHTVVANFIKNINPGESVEYIVTDYENPLHEERAKLEENAEFYDVKFYSDMLKKAYKEVAFM